MHKTKKQININTLEQSQTDELAHLARGLEANGCNNNGIVEWPAEFAASGKVLTQIDSTIDADLWTQKMASSDKSGKQL